MATLDQCAAAIRELAARLATGAGPNGGLPERTVACEITDLATTFTGRIGAAGFGEVTTLPAGSPVDAQVRLRLSSDDLLALVGGRLGVGAAWLSGRVRLDASIPDLLRLRRML